MGHSRWAPVERRGGEGREGNVIPAAQVYLNTIFSTSRAAVEKTQGCRTKAASREATGKGSGRIHPSLWKVCTCCPAFFVLDFTAISISQINASHFTQLISIYHNNITKLFYQKI